VTGEVRTAQGCRSHFALSGRQGWPKGSCSAETLFLLVWRTPTDSLGRDVRPRASAPRTSGAIVAIASAVERSFRPLRRGRDISARCPCLKSSTASSPAACAPCPHHAMNTNAADCNQFNQKSRTRTFPLPLLGERAGVRASLYSILSTSKAEGFNRAMGSRLHGGLATGRTAQSKDDAVEATPPSGVPLRDTADKLSALRRFDPHFQSHPSFNPQLKLRRSLAKVHGHGSHSTLCGHYRIALHLNS
jgi:hypothetical protein